ncbi:Smr/MutS family endonuclease [Endozoicomonas sp. Mp262]|uniref:Smr/MutS family protein n=1 Tax=Endozoicomonas sp. Mp262 TaxID=2919499 RepID=UPI0021D8C813
MPEKDQEDPEKLFQDAMSDVRPIKGKKTHHQQRKPNTGLPESTLAARRAAAEKSQPINAGASLSEAWIEPVEPEQILSFSRSGIQHGRLRQLRMGLLPIQYELDLHGYKIEEARDITCEFIHFCCNKGLSCVRIIHGKSHGSRNRQSTLKSHVNHWLRQLPEVLAFHSAPPAEGGTGSLLVLLKRKRS